MDDEPLFYDNFISTEEFLKEFNDKHLEYDKHEFDEEIVPVRDPVELFLEDFYDNLENQDHAVANYLKNDIHKFNITDWMEKNDIDEVYGIDVNEWKNIRRTQLIKDMINGKNTM